MGLLDNYETLNADLIAIVMLVFGIVVCFFGSKYFKQIIFVIGFVFVGMTTFLLLQNWKSTLKLDNKMVLYISLAMGALAGVLLVIIYQAAVFSVGAICGVIIFQLVYQFVVNFAKVKIPSQYQDLVQIGGIVLFAIAGGFLAFKFVEFVLKGVTAFIGAFMFASASAYFIQRVQGPNKKSNVFDFLEFFTNPNNLRNIRTKCDALCWVCMVLWLALTIAGAYVQYKFHERTKREGDDDEDSPRPRKKRRRRRRQRYDDRWDEYEDSVDERVHYM